MIRKSILIALALMLAVSITACSTVSNLLPIVGALADKLETEQSATVVSNSYTSSASAESSAPASSTAEEDDAASDDSVGSAAQDSEEEQGTQVVKPTTPTVSSGVPDSGTSSNYGGTGSSYQETYTEPSLTVSDDYVELSDSPVVIYVTLIGYDSITVNYSTDVTECTWGEWNGDTIPLTIDPVAAGYDTVELFTDNYELYTCIDVYVEEEYVPAESTVEGELYTNVDYVELMNAPVTVYVTLTGYDTVYWDTDYGEVECSWGEWDGDTIPLTITPVGSGYDCVNIYTENYELYTWIDVYVESDASSDETYTEGSLTVDTDYVELTDYSVTVYVTLTGYDTVYWDTDYGEVECSWGEWDGDTIPLTITPVGSGYDCVNIYTENYELYTWIDVYVENDTTSDETYTEGSLTVSASYLELSDSPATVYVTLTGYDSINVYYSADVVECNWGSWEGDVVPLTIEPVAAGEDVIEIYTDNYELYATIHVVVT